MIHLSKCSGNIKDRHDARTGPVDAVPGLPVVGARSKVLEDEAHIADDQVFGMVPMSFLAGTGSALVDVSGSVGYGGSTIDLWGPPRCANS
jgi:hypothetical protein